jgi:DNA-binding NarL/FixJ family response regulator
MYYVRRAAAMTKPREHAEPEDYRHEQLSRREQEILALIAYGYANREIAAQLSIAEGTVKSHLKRIFGKLGARNRTEAAAIAHRNGLLAIP